MAPSIRSPAPTPAAGAPPPPAPAPEAEAESAAVFFRRQVEGLVSKTDLLERRVDEVVDFHDGKKRGSGGHKAAGEHSRGKPDLFRQFSKILSEITSHNWAGPFKEPVDVEALELHDYHQIISKPMDFSTIRNKMKGKDGNKYNNVREICSDVRLIFSNAMTYNAEGHVVHKMAKTLLEIFEQKWLCFLPKVESEEKRQMEGQSVDISSTNISREAAVAKLAKETGDELSEINKQLEELWTMVVQRCRKMTADEKRKLVAGLYHLSQDDLEKALEIVAQDYPDFHIEAEKMELNIDALVMFMRFLNPFFFSTSIVAVVYHSSMWLRTSPVWVQSETTLWRLKFFVQEALLRKAGIVSGKMNENAKRGACVAVVETSSKRIKKQPY